MSARDDCEREFQRRSLLVSEGVCPHCGSALGRGNEWAPCAFCRVEYQTSVRCGDFEYAERIIDWTPSRPSTPGDPT